jgi:TP901 family phage tail tape measure protein
MATGPGGGSRQIGGAHVTLSIDDRLYYQKLNQAAAALKQLVQSLGSTSGLRSMQQGLVNTTNRWWLMNQAIQRTTQSIDQATAAAVRFNAAMRGQPTSQAAQVIRAQASAQAQLIRANAYAQAQAALAAQRSSRTRPGVPAIPGSDPVTLGDRIAFGGQAFLRDLATKIRQFGKDVGAFGQSGVHYFSGLSASIAGAGGNLGMTRGWITSFRGFLKSISQIGANWSNDLFDLNRRILSFDFRGGFSGKIASAIQNVAHVVNDAGERIFQSLSSRGFHGLAAAVDSAFGTMTTGLFKLGVEFWGISNRFKGPWQRLAGIAAGTGTAIGQVAAAVSTFGERMAIGLRSITQKLPAPWQHLSSFVGQLGSLSGSLSSFIQINSTRIAAGFRAASQQFGRLAPAFNAFGSMATTTGSALWTGIRAATSAGMTVVRGAMSAFGSVMRTSFGLLASGLRSIANTVLGGVGAAFRNIGSLGALGAGIAGGFSLLYIHRQVVDMERELTRLRRTTGATAAEIQQLSRSFNDMGTTLAGVDLNKILELAVMGARLGVPREQLNLFTRDLSKVAAVLEDIPIDEAATRFSGLISVFELQYTDTIKLASALNALDISSNAAARDILDIAGRMSGAASTIGLTAQQTLALATAMRQARVPIETAGTAMGQILGRMTGRDLPEFARLAGMSARAFQQLLGQDALAALVKVEQGLGRLGAIERFRALDQLHLDGQRVRLVMLQLVPVLDELGKYLGIANEEWRTTGSIMSGFRLQAETSSAMFTRMWNNIQLVAVALGHALLPVMKGVSNAISNMAYDITEFLNQRGDRMRAWGERMARVFETLGAVTRVNWGDVGAVLMAAFNDLWGQIQSRVDQLWNQVKKNFFWLRDNIPTLASNAFGNLIAMATRAVMAVLPAIQAMITNAIMAVARAVVAALPAAIRGLVNVPALAPVAAGKIANPQQVPWLQGVQAPPGIGVPGLQMPGVLGMIPGMFGLGADQQRKDLVRRQALGALQDMVARFLGTPIPAWAVWQPWPPCRTLERVLVAFLEAVAVVAGSAALARRWPVAAWEVSVPRWVRIP